MIQQKTGRYLQDFEACVGGITCTRNVLVCHNPPDLNVLEDWFRQDASCRVLMVQSDGPAMLPVEVKNHWQKKLTTDWQRIFWLSKGWNHVDIGQPRETTNRRKVLAFLASDEALPKDPDVQRALGCDMPVYRMALGFALQIARERNDRGDPNLASFLLQAVEPLKDDFSSLLPRLEAAKTKTREERQNIIDEAIKQLATA